MGPAAAWCGVWPCSRAAALAPRSPRGLWPDSCCPVLLGQCGRGRRVLGLFWEQCLHPHVPKSLRLTSLPHASAFGRCSRKLCVLPVDRGGYCADLALSEEEIFDHLCSVRVIWGLAQLLILPLLPASCCK